jgi:N-acetyl-anhydromuramyl-L-alanine amidase AmpD
VKIPAKTSFRTAFAAPLLLLGACATTAHRSPLAEWVPSKNYSERGAQLVVIHYTTEESAEKSLRTLRTRNSDGPVGVQYLVGRDGRIYQLVRDNKAAWHAGGGRWGNMTNLNAASIGIELDNSGYDPYPDVQIERLIVLLDDICKRNHIPKRSVIGHEDLAPGRKIDPGALFPWKRLYDAGFGIWPDPDMGDPPPGFDGWLAMEALGYNVADREGALRSFRHHFRGIQSEGIEFAPEDLKILYALTKPPAYVPDPHESKPDPAKLPQDAPAQQSPASPQMQGPQARQGAPAARAQ